MLQKSNKLGFKMKQYLIKSLPEMQSQKNSKPSWTKKFKNGKIIHTKASAWESKRSKSIFGT